ncbi:hypothetical protein [Parapedobacter sp. DT-150]|uniref:hypothetical protein n=1 Tax=Parapedobacter sp. DT-150 TaxID=3396162 RepID=UPI003F1C540A
MGIVADNPGEKITQKVFHAEIQNDHDAIAGEEARYKPIPRIATVTAEDIRENYLTIKREVRELVMDELERIEMEQPMKPAEKQESADDHPGLALSM